MRIFAIFMFASSISIALAATQLVNLDDPGSLEALKHSRPTHYEKVMEAMDRIQAVPYSEDSVHNLRATLEPDPTRRQIETSFPAKTRLTVPVENTNYQITVRYLNNPATKTPVK